jgi:hypothetical protein
MELDRMYVLAATRSGRAKHLAMEHLLHEFEIFTRIMHDRQPQSLSFGR